MGSISTLIYTSELILCFTICVLSATRHNIFGLLQLLNSTILGLIWRGTTNFVILPSDSQRATSELLDAADLFLASIKSLETQNVSYIFQFLKSDLIFAIKKSLFVHIRCCLQWTLPPFSLIRDFGKQNTRGNVSKISVSLACYRQIGSKSTNYSH